MAEQRVLEMDFSTELGKTQSIRVYEARTDLTGAEVNLVMENIISKNIFSGTGGQITGKVAARIVSTDSTDLTLA
ncbi:MAG: DUF2922 domain-containing protein [Syntrophomonas sp.]|nr:DUF2922 domain-containing protein [Syntrophomonas sp.]